MDNNKKQQVMTKLAQVRMAINHVLRKRAMAKQANWPWWWSPKIIRQQVSELVAAIIEGNQICIDPVARLSKTIGNT